MSLRAVLGDASPLRTYELAIAAPAHTQAVPFRLESTSARQPASSATRRSFLRSETVSPVRGPANRGCGSGCFHE